MTNRLKLVEQDVSEVLWRFAEVYPNYSPSEKEIIDFLKQEVTEKTHTLSELVNREDFLVDHVWEAVKDVSLNYGQQMVKLTHTTMVYIAFECVKSLINQASEDGETIEGFLPKYVVNLSDINLTAQDEIDVERFIYNPT